MSKRLGAKAVRYLIAAFIRIINVLVSESTHNLMATPLKKTGSDILVMRS